MSSYLTRAWNYLPNRPRMPRFFTRRITKGYDKPPSVTSRGPGGPTIYKTDFKNEQIDQKASAQIRPIPQTIINALYRSYISSLKLGDPKRNTDINRFAQQNILQQYTCNRRKYDYVVVANIDTTSTLRDDFGTEYFWAMNDGERVPQKVSNCRFVNTTSRPYFGGKKHKTKKAKRTQRRSKNKNKNKTKKRNKK